jgi:hypothetical protein
VPLWKRQQVQEVLRRMITLFIALRRGRRRHRGD